MDRLWSQSLKQGSLAPSLHSATFPKRNISIISPAPSPGHPSHPLSQGGNNAENNLQVMREERCGPFPSKDPQARRWQASVRICFLPISPSSGETVQQMVPSFPLNFSVLNDSFRRDYPRLNIWIQVQINKKVEQRQRMKKRTGHKNHFTFPLTRHALSHTHQESCSEYRKHPTTFATPS